MLVEILLGVLAFVAGQGFLRFVVEPIQHQRKTIGEIDFACDMYAKDVAISYTPEEIERERERIQSLGRGSI